MLISLLCNIAFIFKLAFYILFLEKSIGNLFQLFLISLYQDYQDIYIKLTFEL